MKRWQSIINDHCNMEIINDDIVKVNTSAWNPDTMQAYDDYIAYNPDIKAFVVDTVEQGNGFVIVETNTYKSIYTYLGY